MSEQRPDEQVAIASRVWQRTCDALAEAERENVELRRRLKLWGDLHHEQGWVDAEAVEDAYREWKFKPRIRVEPGTDTLKLLGRDDDADAT